MKCVCSPLVGLMVLIAGTIAIPPDLHCVDISHTTPCKGWADGTYPICFGCELGYYARCQSNEVTILPCPNVRDDNGNMTRLFFDHVTQTCVEKTESCSVEKSCLNMADSEPCEHLRDGKYHLCNMCDLGYFAKCEANKELQIFPCPHVDDGNGGYLRMLFEPLSQGCSLRTTSCADGRWSPV
ncbi:hypothetical protein PoB_004214500 [Plakobranchus ocellatus]|uniref:Chitin-binding type-2 domain-containing protein n=1 Tax=Plakobranchus ocellatus TaxID=259542 RepID=A0AAV4B4Y9_9GAST|nr:hypothetical protein PoB_004214500 [Plakobranchus ocellatus]